MLAREKKERDEQRQIKNYNALKSRIDKDFIWNEKKIAKKQKRMLQIIQENYSDDSVNFNLVEYESWPLFHSYKYHRNEKFYEDVQKIINELDLSNRLATYLQLDNAKVQAKKHRDYDMIVAIYITI